MLEYYGETRLHASPDTILQFVDRELDDEGVAGTRTCVLVCESLVGFLAEVDEFLDEMRAQWTTEAIKQTIIANQKKGKEQRLIYDKEWVKASLISVKSLALIL